MKWNPLGIVRWCAATAGVFWLASGGFRPSAGTEREFECEQAVAHLQSCCPDFPVTKVECDFNGGCEANDHPLFEVATSQCLQNRSCSEITAADGCARLAKLVTAPPSDDSFSTEPTDDPELCKP